MTPQSQLHKVRKGTTLDILGVSCTWTGETDLHLQLSGVPLRIGIVAYLLTGNEWIVWGSSQLTENPSLQAPLATVTLEWDQERDARLRQLIDQLIFLRDLAPELSQLTLFSEKT